MNLKDIVIDRFNSIADGYYDSVICKRRKVYNDEIDKIVLSYIKQSLNPTILDAGCGTATRSEYYKNELKNCYVCGIDASEKMVIEAAKRKLDGVKHCDITSICYSDNMFDYTTCLFFVFCYLASQNEREKALSELYRTLKPGGILFLDIMHVWHLGEGHNFKRTLFDVLRDKWGFVFTKGLKAGDKLYSTDFQGTKLKGYFHGFNRKEVKRLICHAGFKIKDFRVIGYNTGKEYKLPFKGQLFYILQKPVR